MLGNGTGLRVAGESARRVPEYVAGGLVKQNAKRQATLRTPAPGIQFAGDGFFVWRSEHAPDPRVASFGELNTRSLARGRVPEIENRGDALVRVHQSASTRKVPRDATTAAPPSRTAESRPPAKSISSAIRLGRP